MQIKTDKEWFAIKEVSAIVERSIPTIRKWIDNGILPAVKYGVHYQIRKNELETFMQHTMPTIGNRDNITKTSLKNYYTIEDVSKMYAVKEETIRRWIRENKLPARKSGRTYLLEKNVISNYFRNTNTDNYYTVEEVSSLSNIKDYTIRKLIREKKIPAFKSGKIYLLEKNVISTIIAMCK